MADTLRDGTGAAGRDPASRRFRPLAGFVAGFIGVLVFHQLMLAVLNLAGLTAGQPWALRPAPPLGIPAVLSAAFWGGLWGIALAAAGGSSRAGRDTGWPPSCSARSCRPWSPGSSSSR